MNSVWRRRVCGACGAVFTTEEGAQLHTGIMVEDFQGDVVPLSRDHLFISIHDSCKHRKSALGDATALTQTILTHLLAKHHRGIIKRTEIIQTATEVLQHFDTAAATFYTAYHPLANKTSSTS